MTLRISNSNIGLVECRIVMPRVVKLNVVLLSVMAPGAECSQNRDFDVDKNVIIARVNSTLKESTLQIFDEPVNVNFRRNVNVLRRH
jgi:hypothetical protein